MLDARLQARLAQNYADAAVGYANASVAAFAAMADRSMAMWRPAPALRPQPAGSRDHLSWFNGGQTRPAPAATDLYNPWAAFDIWTTALSPAKPASPPPATPDFMNPWAAFNMWTSAATSAMQPKASAPGMMAMAMSFSPFAIWWGQTLRAPNFAWPMAYSMIASGVPESVAWPAAEANAAVMDAATAVTQQVEHAFASYQSAGGYATAHIWPPKSGALALTALAPFAAWWSMAGTPVPGLA
jgi:hypothetical protein